MITDVNEATVKVTGLPREELIWTAFSECSTEPEKANAIHQLVFAEGMAVDSVLTEQLTGLSNALLVVTDSVGQHAGVEHDHLLESSSAGLLPPERGRPYRRDE